MAETVKVIVRCRPMNTREKDLKCGVVVNMDSKVGQCTINNPNEKKSPPKPFTFDGAYYLDSTTEQIYADIAYPLVEGVTEGYNGTIFAYGQTGCGKSFSMQGITDPATQRGIIPRSFDHIFETIQVSEGSKYLVHASYLEIYNEEIRDLLGKDVKSKLDLKEHPDRGVYVQGLSLHMCRNTGDCEKVMEKGWKNRSTGSTLMNADSSRSHSIFTIHLERSDHDDKGEEHIRVAKLNLVDLAGSERQGKTGATGERLKEATKINLSLSALGNVISALVDGKSKHIPYRDSKLTRLLQDSLGGNTKTLMVACLSPADNNYEETLSTLRYANRAKNIKNKPKINEDPKDAMLREYQEEIERLKAMLRGEIPVDVQEGGSGQSNGVNRSETRVIEKVVNTNPEQLEKEKERIKEEYEGAIQSMKEQFEEMKMSKQALQEEMTRLREHYEQEMSSVEDRVAGLPSPAQVGASGTSGRPSQKSITGADAEGPLQNDRPAISSAAAQEGVEEDAPRRQQQKAAQHAVHIGTVRRNEGPNAPRSSPTEMDGEGSGHAEEAFKRLQQLQQVMVGGEMSNNEEIKEKRRKKKKHAEERRRKLAEEISKMEGDEVMFNVYENIQDEIKAKNKGIEKLKTKNEELKTELADVQSEFEFDRIDYLDTIRKQEKNMLLLQALIEKIHPCLRRDCNYTNLDKIKAQCEWDEENQRWLLPKMTIEKTRLPPADFSQSSQSPNSSEDGGVMPGGRDGSPHVETRQLNGESQPSLYDDLKYEDRFYEKLQNSSGQEVANNYFRNKRAEKLLSQPNESPRGIQVREPSPNLMSPSFTNGYGGGGTSPNGSWSNNNRSPPSSGLRAAQVHKTLNGDDLGARKPLRLESLPQTSSGKHSKKKKKQFNTMEQL